MIRSLQRSVGAVALVAAFAVSPLIPSAHADSGYVRPPAPPAPQYSPAQQVNAPVIPWHPSFAGWYTDGGGSGSSYPYHPGFHPVPAPPPAWSAQ